jgi:hypothetical protein
MTVHAGLQSEHQQLLSDATGTDSTRELRRTLHLTDRAVRQWAARAAVHGRPAHMSAYAHLDPLRPELGHVVQRAAGAEQRTGLDAERELIAQMVWGIGERLAGIDPAAPPASVQHALAQMAVESGEILLAAGRVRTDPTWVTDEANAALRDLGAVR